MKNKLTHAGCVVFREGSEQKRYLVISSSNGKDWVLPKGHIEKGETPEQAALRELEEETGLSGEIVHPLSIQNFQKNNKPFVIQYYLVRMTREKNKKNSEGRTLRWERKSSALLLLSFEEARNAFNEGIQTLKRLK